MHLLSKSLIRKVESILQPSEKAWRAWTSLVEVVTIDEMKIPKCCKIDRIHLKHCLDAFLCIRPSFFKSG